MMVHVEGKLILRSGTGSPSSPTPRTTKEGPSPVSRAPKEGLTSTTFRSTREGLSSSVSRPTKEGPSYPKSTASKGSSSSSESTFSSEEPYSAKTLDTEVSPPLGSNFPKTVGNSEGDPKSIPISDPALLELSRLKHGSAGEKDKLLVNCFEMTPKPGSKLYHYHVDVTPEPQDARQRKRAFDLFLQKAPCLSPLRRDRRVPIVAVDNRSTMITMERIKPQSNKDDDRHQCQIAYYEEGKERPKKEPSINSHTFTVSFVRELDLQKMMNFLASGAGRSHRGPMLQALDVVMARKPSMLTRIAKTTNGKRSIPTVELGKLGGGLIALQCYQACVRMAGPRLLLNISPRTANSIQEGSLLKLMEDLKEGGKGVDQLHEYLKGIRVQLTHLTNNNGSPKIATISGLASFPTLGANAEQASFSSRGEETSVAKYFHQSKLTQWTDCLAFPQEISSLIISRIHSGIPRNACRQRWQ